MTKAQTLLAVGDMILGGPDPDSNFALTVEHSVSGLQI